MTRKLPALLALLPAACGDLSQIVKLMTLTDGKIDLYSGNDDQTVPIMAIPPSAVSTASCAVAPVPVP